MEPMSATAQLPGQVWRRIVIVAALVSAVVGGVVAVAERTTASEPAPVSYASRRLGRSFLPRAHRPPAAGMGLRAPPALTDGPTRGSPRTPAVRGDRSSGR
jgi:hypothetical protein